MVPLHGRPVIESGNDKLRERNRLRFAFDDDLNGGIVGPCPSALDQDVEGRPRFVDDEDRLVEMSREGRCRLPWCITPPRPQATMAARAFGGRRSSCRNRKSPRDSLPTRAAGSGSKARGLVRIADGDDGRYERTRVVCSCR